MSESLNYPLIEMRQRFAERWPNFTVEEIFSPDCLHNNLIHKLNPYSMDMLQWLRDAVGKPILVNHAGLKLRGVRSVKDNQVAGGADDSMHIAGSAFDISIKGMAINDIVDEAIKAGFKGIGRGDNFVHVDTRLVTHPIIWEY